MEVKFKIMESGKVGTNNSLIVSGKLLTCEALDTALEIASNTISNSASDVFSILPSKILYAAQYSEDKLVPYPVFLVKTKDSVKLWHYMFISIKNGLILFTTKKECAEFCKEQMKVVSRSEIRKLLSSVKIRLQKSRKKIHNLIDTIEIQNLNQQRICGAV